MSYFLFRFSLGNRLTAQRYLQQFQELYTEEGRKSVKISTCVANQNHHHQKSQQQQQQQQSHSQQQQQQQQQQHHQQHNSSSSSTNHHSIKTETTTTVSSTAPESTLTVNISRSFAPTPNSVLSQGNTYILASSVQGLQQPLNLGSNVVMSLSSSLAQSLVSGNSQISVAGKSKTGKSCLVP